MKWLYLLLSILVSSCMYAQSDSVLLGRVELDSMFYNLWNTPEEDIFSIANTAKDEEYLTKYEKDIFLYLNLARLNPSLFAETYAANYNGLPGMPKGYAFEERKESLIKELLDMEPLDLLYPDSIIYEHARCFAIEAGMKGIIGHDRDDVSCGSVFQECCTYFLIDGLDIVMGLLIDPGEQNEDLGHRKTCLGHFGLMGVSIQPHAETDFNAVLNFGFRPEKIYSDTLVDGRFYKGTRDIAGNLHGVGVLEQKDGYRYEGYWANNKMHGYGVLSMKNGCKYEGYWENNKMHGYGIFHQIDGSKYGGEWINGEVHGKITFLTKLGSEYEGEFENGKLIKDWHLVTNEKKKISSSLFTRTHFRR